MKTKEELIALKNEIEALGKKLAELSPEELKLVTGGSNPFDIPDAPGGGDGNFDIHVYKNGVKDFTP